MRKKRGYPAMKQKEKDSKREKRRFWRKKQNALICRNLGMIYLEKRINEHIFIIKDMI